MMSGAGKRVLIFRNPKAGARSGVAEVDLLEGLLSGRGYQVEQASVVDDYRDRIADLASSGVEFSVVAAGGDGTVGLVVNHTPSDVPIAILPLGTENLLAKQLGVRQDAHQVCEMVCGGRVDKIDAGEADGRLFLLMAGCGFDAEVVQRMHRERTGHIHRLSYAKPILESIRSYQYPELRVYCDPPSEAPIQARWVFVVNLPRYAGGLRIAPQARGDDGLLDVCTFRHGSLLTGLRYLGGVALGTHERWNDFQTVRTRCLRIESDQPVPYQLDGDPGGQLPVDVRVLPGRTTLYIPVDAAKLAS